jgi:hypothetical protein
MTESDRSQLPASDGGDPSSHEPWIGLWIYQVRIFVTMFRDSPPIDPRKPEPFPDTLLKFSKGELCSATDVTELLSGAVALAGTAAAEVGPLTGRVVDAWLRKEAGAFRDAIASFAAFYEHACTARDAVDTESVFAEWIERERPEVLERAVALLPAVLFTRARDVDAPSQVRKLLTDLREIRTAARRVVAQIAHAPENSVVDLAGLSRQLTATAGGIDTVLKICEDGWRSTGRPHDHLGPLLSILLQKAGLSYREIGATLGVSGDAVRKQVRRPKAKRRGARGDGANQR